MFPRHCSFFPAQWRHHTALPLTGCVIGCFGTLPASKPQPRRLAGSIHHYILKNPSKKSGNDSPLGCSQQHKKESVKH